MCPARRAARRVFTKRLMEISILIRENSDEIRIQITSNDDFKGKACSELRSVAEAGFMREFPAWLSITIKSEPRRNGKRPPDFRIRATRTRDVGGWYETAFTARPYA